MRLVTTVVLAFVVVAAVPGIAAAKRRPTRCCIMVPADDGGERPYCFFLNVRPARRGRGVCRAIGGVPQPPFGAGR